MTKREFITIVAESSGLSNAQATTAVDAILSVLTEMLRSGDAIALPGLGRLATTSRREQLGLNAKLLRDHAAALEDGTKRSKETLDASIRTLREIAAAR